MTAERDAAPDTVGLTADIVVAFVSRNAVAPADLPGLIATVHASLNRLASDAKEPEAQAPVPAVSIRRSIQPDHLVCLEDGKTFKSLKRHLRSRYGLTPEQYRTKWNLPYDYPMVAPNYAAARSELAKSMGLGQQRRKSRTPSAAPARRAG